MTSIRKLFKKPVLYFVADAGLIGKRSILTVVRQAVAGGAGIIQLRAKDFSTGEFLKKSKTLHDFLIKKGTPFIINDRADVAVACGADGVHLGQDDLPIADARKMLGRKKIIGLSCHTVSQAKKAQSEGADYIGVGQVFYTMTKGITQHLIGVKKLAAIAKSVSIPVIAIGGIKPENAADVMKSGCAGVAVVSAIAAAKNPRRAAEQFFFTCGLPQV
ncbi:MAG: thiamine-phosphate synthase [bacterium]|nr:MAG: thiamine-phosphate synthase [bacterium]